MQVVLFILAVVLLIGLVLIHEYGHLIAARRNGVDVEEYGLGFPPRITARKLKSGLVLSLNWLPLGGFVKLKGEHDDTDKPGTFGAASLGTKAKILLAGVGMNFLVGVVLLIILAVVGMPVLIDKNYNGVDQFTVHRDTKINRQQAIISSVLPGSPAAKAGLSSQDTIISIAGAGRVYQIHSAGDLHQATSQLAGQEARVVYEHNGGQHINYVHLLSKAEVQASQNTNNPKGYLGVVPANLVIQRSTWSAPIVAVGLAGQFTWLTLQGIGHAIAGLGSYIAGTVSGNHTASVQGQNQAESQVGGPVAITEILWHSGSLGFNFMLALIAVLSLTLGLINVLPIPALDGGRLALILISRGILRRPLNRDTEAKIVGAGYLLIFGLIILITIVDVKRTF